MATFWKLVHEFRNNQRKVLIHDTEILTARAQFACDLMKQVGIATADPSLKEDSAGRAVFTIMEANKVAKRACDIAESAFLEFEKRGWIVNGPDISELVDDPEKKLNLI